MAVDQTGPPISDNVSENGTTLKTRYAGQRLDPHGPVRRKGFRTYQITSRRPVHRSPKRG